MMNGKVWSIPPSQHFKSLGLTYRKYAEFPILPHDLRMEIALTLTELTGHAFLRRDVHDQELITDVANHVAEAPRLVLLDDKNGYTSAYIISQVSVWQSRTVYDLSGIIIAAEWQNKGLGYDLLSYDLFETGAEVLILRTQNLSMYKLAGKVAELNEALAHHMAPDYYPRNLDGNINRGVYREGHSLYEDEVRFASQAIDWIDWQAGDGLVVAGYVKR